MEPITKILDRMTSDQLINLKIEYESLISKDQLNNLFSQNLDNLKWNRSFFMKNISIYKKMFPTQSINFSYEQYEKRISRILEMIPDFCQTMWKKEKRSNFMSDILDDQYNDQDSSDEEDNNEDPNKKKDKDKLNQLLQQTSQLFIHIKRRFKSDPSLIFLRDPNAPNDTDEEYDLQMSDDSCDQFDFIIYDVLNSFFLRLYLFQNGLPYKNELIDQEI